MTERSSDEAPLHGSFGCRPALQSDEFGSYYACSCGWRSDDGQSISKARSVVASLRGVVQAVELLAKDPVHECGETCEAWGCDVKGATYYVTLPKLRAALAAAADAPQSADLTCNVCGEPVFYLPDPQARVPLHRSTHRPSCPSRAQPSRPADEGGSAMSTGAQLIAAERQRQLDVEGWTRGHDQGHEYELEAAAISYAVWGDAERPPAMWPWDASWWKPKDRLRNLVRAGALFQAAGESVELIPAMRYWGQRDLIVAEIDRLGGCTR